jgi:hypothetical protein
MPDFLEVGSKWQNYIYWKSVPQIKLNGQSSTPQKEVSGW